MTGGERPLNKWKMNRTGEPDLFAKQWVASAMGFECSFFRHVLVVKLAKALR